MTGAEIVIVGAGVMGASVAWHLATMGAKSILLLDRGAEAGTGSTGRATGGFRSQYASGANVRLSRLSREKLLRFREETGGDAAYQPHGYLFLATSDAHLAILRDAQAVQHSEGAREATMLSVDDVPRLQPHVLLDEVVGAAFCPTDGFMRPLGILAGYLAAAERLGAQVRWEADVTGVDRRGNRIVALRTATDTIGCDVVVNAAGAWANTVSGFAGSQLPVVPVRRQVLATVPTNALPPSTPMTIFTGDNFHFRVRDGRVLMLLPLDTPRQNPFDTGFEASWAQEVVSRAHARVPVLRDVAVDLAASWAGLYEMSPDHHAILGRAPGCDNLYLINGSSGHGVMHSPALGQLLAEEMLGRPKALDTYPFRPERFAEGAPNPAPVLL